MSCFLFDKIIFGPVLSRRLGNSLGINLLPHNKKICSFNCVYCECGWTKPGHNIIEQPYKREVVSEALETVLKKMSLQNDPLDHITFGGNGEPTLHPEFHNIVDDVISLRDKYFPDVKLTVLTNATTLLNSNTVAALRKIDKPILKIDAGNENTFKLINKPLTNINLNTIVNSIIDAKIENTIIQTLFLRGTIDGYHIDNTAENELNVWLRYLQQIKPKFVMIYGIARETPAKNLVKISKQELDGIVLKIKKLGIDAEAF